MKQQSKPEKQGDPMPDGTSLEGIAPPNNSPAPLTERPPFDKGRRYVEGVIFIVIPILEFIVFGMILSFIAKEILVAGFLRNKAERIDVVNFLEFTHKNWIAGLSIFIILISRTLIKKIEEMVWISKDGANFKNGKGSEK